MYVGYIFDYKGMENIFNDFFYGRAYCFALRCAGF